MTETLNYDCLGNFCALMMGKPFITHPMNIEMDHMMETLIRLRQIHPRRLHRVNTKVVKMKTRSPSQAAAQALTMTTTKTAH